MAEAKMVTFMLRNGEQRVYQDVTRVDDSRRHLVLVYSNDVLVAQLNKHDVVKFAFTQPAPATDETAETMRQPPKLHRSGSWDSGQPVLSEHRLRQ